MFSGTMFTAKRIFLNNKRLALCISTTAVRTCDKPSKTIRILNSFFEDTDKRDKGKKKKNLKYKEQSVSSEEKQKAKDELKSLLEGLAVETEPAEGEGAVPEFKELLKAQISKREARAQSKKKFQTRLFEAAEDVAQSLGGDKEKIKDDLFSQLKTIRVEDELHSDSDLALGKAVEPHPVADPKEALEGLFSSNRLQIFIEADQPKPVVKLNIWDSLEQEELAYLATRSPKNQIEEWILWTEQGKLWHFPIDNDQGMEKEAAVDFTQHVFLEEHLEPWCPKKGPLKKFMDLVLVGLSKNPYLTVEDKKEHIFWYRDYFENKKKLLKELGALGPAKELGEAPDSKETV